MQQGKCNALYTAMHYHIGIINSINRFNNYRHFYANNNIVNDLHFCASQTLPQNKSVYTVHTHLCTVRTKNIIYILTMLNTISVVAEYFVLISAKSLLMTLGRWTCGMLS